jgi:hypothetical protein
MKTIIPTETKYSKTISNKIVQTQALYYACLESDKRKKLIISYHPNDLLEQHSQVLSEKNQLQEYLES